MNITTRWQASTPHLLSILRIVAGFLFIQYGSTKLFAFPAAVMPGGGTAALMSLPGLAATLELIGGMLLLVGLFTRPVGRLHPVRRDGGGVFLGSCRAGDLASSQRRRPGGFLRLSLALHLRRRTRSLEH